MKKSFYLLTILALLMQPLMPSWLQQTGDETQAPNYPVHYVKPAATGTGDCSSWENACGLTPALAAAASGDEIWVQRGTYKPTIFIDRSATFALETGVAIFGGFTGVETSRDQRNWVTNVTTLSGDIGVQGNNSDNSYHVVTGINVGTTARLDGFTITGGNADLALLHWEWGGGMYLQDSSPTIRNVVFQSNWANAGGGMFIYGGEPWLEDVRFSQNLALINGGGLHTYHDASPTLTSVEFISNTVTSIWSPSGGGMFNMDSSPTLIGVTFTQNTLTCITQSCLANGGGMYNRDSSLDMDDVTFTQNRASCAALNCVANGGGMYNRDSSLAMNVITFTQNLASCSGGCLTYGGGMYNVNSSGGTSWEDLTFSSNQASIWGGGMITIGSSPSLVGVTVTGNSAESGGGMFINGGAPELVDATFQGNSAIINGGGLLTYGQANSSLTNVTFFGNTANNNGGGLYTINASTSLTTTTFSANTATWDGGGMYSDNQSRLSLTNVDFITNTASHDGGGLFNYMNPTLTLNDVTFIDNRASSQDGGGMYTSNSSPTLTNVTFIDNRASRDGGGMFTNMGSPTLDEVIFSGNSTISANGGGMYNVVSSPTLTNVDFITNMANATGGGMFNLESPASLTHVSFSGNSAMTGDGGGMYNDDSSPTLTDVNFSANSALSSNGGGMYTSNGNPKLEQVTFSGNTASQNGGGMYTSGGKPKLVNVTFSGNSASQDGGGIYNVNGSPGITQTVFYTNTAVTSGGGIYNLNCSAGYPPALLNVLFNANRASGTNGQGGGLYNDNCATKLTNVTMVHNYAGLYGGGVSAAGTNPTLQNSLLWGNSASGTTADQQFHGSTTMVFNTTIQQSASDPSPFVDILGPDGVPGTRDEDLHPTYPSTYADGAVIDGGVEDNLPFDTHDLDDDGITSEKLPIDLDGHGRIYADNDLDGNCDPVTTLESDGLDQVDRGAFENVGCWAWHMHYGDVKLEKGREYRRGFHYQIDDPSTVTISQTLSAYAQERSDGYLEIALRSYEIALECAATVTQTRQATRGILDVIWEQATGAMLEGNEKMVNVLDVTGSGSSDNGIDQLIEARNLYDEAVHGYLEPLAGGDYPDLIETLTISRTSPISSTQTSLVDLERLVKASAGKSRATLELAERQLRDGQEPQAEQTLRQGAFQARAEMALLYSLWPEVADTVDYTALLRNIGDIDRLYGYIVSGKNPLGYDQDFVPFSFDYEHPEANNYLQTWYLAGRDKEAAGTSVTNAAGKQKEVDDDYRAMQTRLNEARQHYNGILIGLCGALPGGLPDREHCAGGDIQEQVEVVENAMLQIERVILQMGNQNALIRIEQDRAAAEVGIRYATAQLITANGEQLASLASQEVTTELYKDTTEGIFSIIKGAYSGARPLGIATPSLSVGQILLGGLLGGTVAAFEWQSQNAKAEELAEIAASKERLYAAQQAVVQYAEGQIASANSLALQRQYMLKFAELDVDLAIAMNNLQKELAHMVNLRNQAEYALAEQAKAQAFTTLLYQDPAGRVLRETYMEMAHYRYEKALDSAYKAGKALAYEINEDVTYTGLPLSSLDNLYPLQDVNLLGESLKQMDDAYIAWLGSVHAPQADTYNNVYLSLAVGFDNDPSSTREEKFNAFIRNPDNRVDTDNDGCPEVQFSFMTSNETGNKLGLYTSVFNDKIKTIQMRVYGTDLFTGTQSAAIAGIRLTQGGSSLIRTRFSHVHQGGADDLRFYNLDPWTITLQAATNNNSLPGPFTGLASRSVAATDWTLNIEGGNGSACGNLRLDHIEDIQLIINHEYYPLQSGLTGAGLDETPPIRGYQPIRRSLPSLALASPFAESPIAPSADNDLNGLFIGTLAITSPLYTPPVELAIQLNDAAGSLSGFISPTLMFPILPGSGQGVALSGSWSGSSFSLSAPPFVSNLMPGIPITRTLHFQPGLIASTEITRTLSGVYLETLEGLTPEPLQMRGIFRLERPLRPLQAGFGASPRSVYVGDNVYFSDGSLGRPVSWSWTFGDGGTSTQQNPVHVYATPGEYTVSLTISDGFSTHTHTETEFMSVRTPNAPPQANFSASVLGGRVPLQVHFQDHSLGGPTHWSWDFGDGSTSTQRNPTHTYNRPGVFTVSLTVSNNYGSDIYTWTDAITVDNAMLYLPMLRK